MKEIKRRNMPSELVIVIAMFINSFSMSLMVKSQLGISTLSSVPLVLSKVFSVLSQGVFTIIIQVLLLLILIIITRQPKPGYIGAFILAVIFGFMVDLFNWLMGMVNFDPLWMRIIYFFVGYFGMAFGAALFIKSRMPVMPFDLFVRDLSEYKGWQVKWVKSILDAIFVIIAVTVSYVALKEIVGVGIGTVVAVLFTGTITQFIAGRLTRKFTFNPVTPPGKWIVKITEIQKEVEHE